MGEQFKQSQIQTIPDSNNSPLGAPKTPIILLRFLRSVERLRFKLFLNLLEDALLRSKLDFL